MPRPNISAATAAVEASRAAWIDAIDRAVPNGRQRLVQMVEANADLGISWRLKKVFVVNMPHDGKVLTILGVNPDATVEIPWQLGKHNDSFRIFCEYLSAGIPGAVVRRTAKLWTVKMEKGHKISLPQLLDAADSFRDGLEKLCAILRRADTAG